VELVRHGENGLLVAPDNSHEFSNAIIQVLESTPDRYALLSNAALHEGQKYGIGGCAAAHLDLYREVASVRS
jgi:glycosyltransferase involved in cell wall biosynthesis